MTALSFYTLFISACIVGAYAWSSTPFQPPSYPLAVRTPYLSTWLPQAQVGSALNDGWAEFWTGQIAAWTGFMRVDDKTFSFMGGAGMEGLLKATQISANFTSTQSTFVLRAGQTGVEVIVTFMSPVEPEDTLKQSIPFSYLSLSVSNAGNHKVALYTDISAEWLSADGAALVNWKTTDNGDGTRTHSVGLKEQLVYGEAGDHILYGNIHYSTSGGNYQTGADTDVRPQFVKSGSLSNTEDTKYRAISDAWPVFAFSHDWTGEEIVMSIGHVRDPVIQYGPEGATRSPYWTSGFSSVGAMISAFHADFKSAMERANKLDQKIREDAEKISSDYADIVELSIRQAFAATELTIAENDPADVLMFMKEISSNGNMNTVDVIFPTWPLYLYFNPKYGKYLLDALLRYQSTGHYPNKYSIHDLGSHYPNATGHNDGKDEAMPIEESGNMIIMALSYAQKTGDLSMVTEYSSLFQQWAQYLVENSMVPDHQLSTDDFAGPLSNQTNLAIKGIVAIRAMSEISKLLGQQEASDRYKSTAESYVSQLLEMSTSASGEHLTLSYGNSSSWGLTYNLYGDLLCGLNLFDDSVYEMQTEWYQNVINQYGIPLDTRADYTKSDWMMWTAATMTSSSTRDSMIRALRTWVSTGKAGSQPFGDWYGTKNNADVTVQGFKARSVVGGHLALMTLPTSNTLPESGSNGGNSSDSTDDQDSASQLFGGLCQLISLVVTLFLMR